jgi:hypothetical protein
MYSKDFRIRHLLAIFFAIGISQELTTLLNLEINFLTIIYVVSLLIIVFNFSGLKKYIWPPGLGLVGLFSIIYLIFDFIGYKEDFFKKVSSIVSILVWIRCIRYLSEDDENNEIIDGNENIRKI